MFKKYCTFYLVIGIFLVLILDAKTVLIGAKDGISLCIQTVIPSLFPFFILSTFITCNISSAPTIILSPIGRLCRMPKGSEVLLLLGFLGGYPVGAKAVSEAYLDKKLSHEDAERIIGFCNNPGPAFIFGMVATLFHSTLIAWILWLINIIAAIITAVVLPGKRSKKDFISTQMPVKITDAMSKSLHIMANVCGWVVIFRIIIAFIKRWFLHSLSMQGQIAIIGILELSNGCYFLSNITSEAQRFLFCSLFLTFGGLCVTMQTASQLNGLSLYVYLRTKLLQTLISALISVVLQPVLFNVTVPISIIPILSTCLFVAIITLRKSNRKKEWKLISKCSTI